MSNNNNAGIAANAANKAREEAENAAIASNRVINSAINGDSNGVVNNSMMANAKALNSANAAQIAAASALKAQQEADKEKSSLTQTIINWVGLGVSGFIILVIIVVSLLWYFIGCDRLGFRRF